MVARSVVEFLDNDKSEFLSPEELKSLARQTIVKSTELTVPDIANRLNLSRQRVYQALSDAPHNIDTGIDICHQIIALGGHEVEQGNITLVKLKD